MFLVVDYVQIFELAVKNNSIKSADIKAIFDEEKKTNLEDNNDINDFNNVNEEVFIEEYIAATTAVVAVDTNSDSNSDSDSDDDSPTTPTAEKQPKVGNDLRSIEEKVEDDEKEDDNVIIDDIVMQCPVCTTNQIGTNIQNYEICRFVPPPPRKAIIEVHKFITELN